MSDDQLVMRLMDRARDSKRCTDTARDYKPEQYSPVAVDEVLDAERQLGFALPQLLQRLFLEVGNGGFGPSYGLLGLKGGAVNEDGLGCVEVYDRNRCPDADDPYWHWPTGLLPLGHLGCAMFACVDCSSESSSIIWFEPNPHEIGGPWDDSFIPLSPSLSEWLTAWLDGKENDLYEQAWKAKFGAENWES